MRTIILITLLLLCGCVSKASQTINIDKEYLILLHNNQRSSKHVLTKDGMLEKFAQKHAEWMAKNNSMKHSKLNFNGFNYKAENIAYGQSSEDEEMADWMNSQKHKENILNSKYKRIGIGYSKSKNGTHYWCTVFGG